MEKQWKQWQTLFFWAPKSLQMVTAAMKLKTLTPRRLSYLFLLFFGTLHSDVYIFSFLLCFSLLFFAEYIMGNAGLEESQAGIKTAGRNINNLRYAYDTILMTEIEEELKSLLRMKEESEKAGLKFNIQKTKIMSSGPITSRQTEGEKVEVFLGLQTVAMKLKDTCSLERKLWQT